MKKIFLTSFFIPAVLCSLFAQGRFNPNELQGEFGITIGAAHYFGDLNTRAAINRPKIALGAFYRKQFNNYLAARLAVHYAQLGYSDKYSKNEYQKIRNLSFNTDILEVTLSGDFNFFRYEPGTTDHNFTPYVTLGVGLFSFNPYAYLEGKKYYLRPLGTEGQNIPFKDTVSGKTRTPYGSMALCVPIGFGIKYNINDRMNISFQVAHRLTFTDYLDDVSTTYVGELNSAGEPNFPNPVAFALQDRSNEKVVVPIGKKGIQRGWSKQKDQYVIAEIGITFNLTKYRCPSDF